MPCILYSFLLAFVFTKLCPICAERTGGSFKGGTDICSPLIRGSELVGDNIEWAGADLLMVTGNLIPSLSFIITFFHYSITPSYSILSFLSELLYFFLITQVADHTTHVIDQCTCVFSTHSCSTLSLNQAHVSRSMYYDKHPFPAIF